MAWTTKADRFNAKSLKVVDTPDNIGPGVYGGHDSHKAHPSMAPFNSSSDRTAPECGPRVAVSKDTVPPPGAYDPKLPCAYDAGLPRKTVPFLGGTERADPAAKSTVPGPGRYTLEKPMEVLPCRTMGLPGGKKVMLKSQSAPSIPRGGQCFGYDEMGNGKLIMQGPKDGRLYLTGENEDSAGPGHYEGHRVEAHQPRAVGGKFLGGAARQPHKAPEAPGPGHYAPPKPREQGCYSSFVSGTTQRPVQSKKKKSSTPGPGQYSKDLVSSPNLREQHPELQYFGSTSERFKSDAVVPDGPGPGQYMQRQRVVLKSNWGASDRFSEGGPKAPLQPGPGSYNPATTDGKTTGVLGTASLLGSTGTLAFGSMETRQGAGGRGCGAAATAPGPGAYELIEYEPTERHQDNTRGRLKKVPRPAPSASTPDMMVPKEVRDAHGPPPGAYNPVHVGDIGCVMRLPPKGEGFLSGGSRLAKPAKRGAEPDPGMYNADPGLVTGGKRTGTFNRAVVEGAPQSGRPRGLGFGHQTRRFKKEPGVVGAPGPGAYHMDPDWTKKNFNVHYGDI